MILAWSVLLLPYPLLDVIRDLLDELPSVMTLAFPKPSAAGGASRVRVSPE